MRPSYPTFPSARAARRRGFTTLEALVATAILSFVALAVGGALSAGRQQSQNAQDTIKAALLGRALLDEILRLPFNDPNGYTTIGPDTGNTTRLLFDNMDDYSGYTDGPASVSYLSVDASGNATTTAYPAEYQGFTRTVTMTATPVTPPGWGRTINGLLVQVVVSRNGRPLVTLQRFICS